MKIEVVFEFSASGNAVFVITVNQKIIYLMQNMKHMEVLRLIFLFRVECIRNVCEI